MKAVVERIQTYSQGSYTEETLMALELDRDAARNLFENGYAAFYADIYPDKAITDKSVITLYNKDMKIKDKQT